MILKPEEKIHVVLRRRFEAEPRRHFAGVVEESTDTLAVARGYAFLFDASRNEFRRAVEERRRVVSFTDAGNIINILPPDVVVENLTYNLGEGGRYLVTDGGSFRMDVNEFGLRR